MSTFAPLHLSLPATSANLGPGFDTLGLAMALYLTIDAVAAPEFSIQATGRNADLCTRLDRNLVLSTYRNILQQSNQPIQPIHLILHNEIPLGMGCGSSASALLAGVLLANHFGNLGWSGDQILTEACRREGHPDNVAACWRGGMTISSMSGSTVETATCGIDLNWNLMVALPSTSLATAKARALLPPTYTRADAVTNIQNATLLVAAFAQNRPELLHTAMADRLHQPYRKQACPLLPRLLPLVDHPGVYGIALSGAGPSILLITDAAGDSESLVNAIRHAAGDSQLEILQTTIGHGVTVNGAVAG